MSAIVVGNAPDDGRPPLGDGAVDYMPLSSRIKVAGEINRLWAEFVTEMHSGDTRGPEVAEKFWKYVLAGG
jgi:hypothetical protein